MPASFQSDDMPTLTNTIRTARKDYRCYLCGETIQRRTRYVKHTGVDRDGWWDYEMHVDCHEYAYDTFDPWAWESFFEGDVDRADVEAYTEKNRNIAEAAAGVRTDPGLTAKAVAASAFTTTNRRRP